MPQHVNKNKESICPPETDMNRSFSAGKIWTHHEGGKLGLSLPRTSWDLREQLAIQKANMVSGRRGRKSEHRQIYLFSHEKELNKEDKEHRKKGGSKEGAGTLGKQSNRLDGNPISI